MTLRKLPWFKRGGFPPGTFQGSEVPVSPERAAEIRESLRASISQGTPPPAFSPRHSYGGGGTIHRTGTIDVVLNKHGYPIAVWFRCLSLPFTVTQETTDDPVLNPKDKYVEEITYVDLPSEESSQ
jgi:hypothetical protein